jgi:hypothetical protein
VSFLGGRSNEEKQRSATIGQQAGALGDYGETALARSGAAFKQLKKTTQPAINFWSQLLSGDRDAIASILSPETSAISNRYDQQAKSLVDFNPRSGALASSLVNLGNQETRDVSNLFNQVRPTAAQNLAQLGGLFGGVSAQQGGLGTGAFGQSSQNLFGLNAEAEQQRQRVAQFWGSLGGAAGGLLTNFFLPGGIFNQPKKPTTGGAGGGGFNFG